MLFFFSTSAEVSLRTECRKKERTGRAARVMSGARRADLERRVLKGRRTRSMQHWFTAQSARLRPGVLVVFPTMLKDWATTCPSLHLQSMSCVMAPVRSTVFRSGMSSFGVFFVCTHCRLKGPGWGCSKTIWLRSLTLQLCALLWVEIGKSSDLRSWLQGFPPMWTLRGQAQASAKARKQEWGSKLSGAASTSERRDWERGGVVWRW